MLNTSMQCNNVVIYLLKFLFVGQAQCVSPQAYFFNVVVYKRIRAMIMDQGGSAKRVDLETKKQLF